MFIAVKFARHDARSYTYTYDGDVIPEPGDTATVEARGETKTVYISKVDVPEPAFACKPILAVQKVERPAPSNNPPPAAELFADEIESIKERAANFGPITEANAGDARDLIGLAKQLAKDIDAKRDEEKRPHLEAGRQIDGTYKPLVEAARAAPAPLELALLNFTKERTRAAEEAAREARRKAEEEARKAAELAADPILGDDVIADAKIAQQRAEVAEASVKVVSSVKGSEGFRAASVRKTHRAKVTDWKALVAYFADHPDVRAAAEKAANAAIRASKGSASIPGVEVETVETLV